jgi:hypothetical protein
MLMGAAEQQVFAHRAISEKTRTLSDFTQAGVHNWASRLTIEINFTKSFGVIRNRSLDVAAVGGLVHEGS